MGILDGLKTKAVPQHDKSMELPKTSVNKDATRSTTGEGGDEQGPGPRKS